MIRAKLVQDGDHQTIVLPPSIHLEGDEVLVECVGSSGSLTISPFQPDGPIDWQAAFKSFDEAEFPDNFFGDREDVVQESRDF